VADRAIGIPFAKEGDSTSSETPLPALLLTGWLEWTFVASRSGDP